MTKLQVKERPKPSCFVWTSNSQIVCESAQTRFHIKSPPCLFIKKSVLSLARPNFLTGAIIQTRFQASLLAPPADDLNFVSGFIRSNPLVKGSIKAYVSAYIIRAGVYGDGTLIRIGLLLTLSYVQGTGSCLRLSFRLTALELRAGIFCGWRKWS